MRHEQVYGSIQRISAPTIGTKFLGRSCLLIINERNPDFTKSLEGSYKILTSVELKDK
jgi:hypothetical protein